jgi:hypothetical protein
VNVTLSDIRVNPSSTAAAAEGGWNPVPIATGKIDLLHLQDGVLATLVQTLVPAGDYTQMRLPLASNRGSALGNSVVPSVGTETALTTASGQQSGLKVNVEIKIAADQMADFVVTSNGHVTAVVTGMVVQDPGHRWPRRMQPEA